MTLPRHKTKIICTIGPASATPEMLERLVLAGMNICRLNFSHGDFDSHRRNIRLIREVAKTTGRRIAILADLPGPKMRVGKLKNGQITLAAGATTTLTTEAVEGDEARLPVHFPELTRSVGLGDRIYLNDGFIQLTAQHVGETEIRCGVDVGGILLSRKGVNIPGKEIAVNAFTDRDQQIMQFAIREGIDAVSVSFVQHARDIEAARQAAEQAGRVPFLIAKIERSLAVERIDAILEAADGIMVARGDLGVETPIESIGLIQKRLIQAANRAGKPVITATQMLESMVSNSRPTRAEATDVANAILDGTDCVMLSEESAMGHYPTEAASTLARIAEAVETEVAGSKLGGQIRSAYQRQIAPETNVRARIRDAIALNVAAAVGRLEAGLVITPTLKGTITRRISGFRLPAWILAFSPRADTCQQLCFSYGVHSIQLPTDEPSWQNTARNWLKQHDLFHGVAVITHRWIKGEVRATNRMEIIDIEDFFGHEA